MLRNFITTLLVVAFVQANAWDGVLFDSIGIEKRGGKRYVIHKIEAKETLYSISKKYNVMIEDIKKSNEDLTTDLKIGQTIFIPSRYQGPITKEQGGTHTVEKGETLFAISRKYKVTVADIQKANPEIANTEIQPGQILVIPGLEDNSTKEVSTQGGETTHKVVSKETFYSISRKYSITVQELKEANPDIADLKAGQVIVIPVKGLKKEDSKKGSLAEKKEEEKERNKVENKDAYVEVKKQTSSSVTMNMPVLNNLKKDSYTKISETGMVEVYEENSGFHYALHKTAPIGTIIYLINEETGQKVYVRVMGRLSQDDSGVLMKISPKAYEKIAKGAAKVKVNASYIP